MITRKKEMARMRKEKESKVGRKGRNTEENQKERKKERKKPTNKQKGRAWFTLQSTNRHFLSHGESLTENLCMHNPTDINHVLIAGG